MSTYINSDFNLLTTETKIIPLNGRWSVGDYAIQVSAGSALVEGTISQINRGQTAVWSTLDDSGGTPLTAVVIASGLVDIQNNPMEAIRITATGTTTGRVMQGGLTDWGP